MKKLLSYLVMFIVLIIIGFYGEIRKQVTGRSSHNDILYETYYGMIEYTFQSTGVTHLVFQKADSDRSFCYELNEDYLKGLKTTCPDCVIKSESCSTSLPSAYQDIFSDKPMALPFLSAPNKRIVVLGIPVQQAISLCREMAEAWRMGMNQEAKCITQADSSPSQVFGLASKSTVVVIGYDNSGDVTSLGSGVVLSDGNIATACHMIKDPSKVSVRYKQKEYPAAIQYTDWDRDICSLEVDGLLAPPTPVGSTMGLSIGDKVYAVGAPWGLELRLSEGIVSNLRSFENGQYIQTTAATFPGSSGGGLFDEKGHLLGLSSFHRTDEEGMSFFLPVEWITELPGRHSEIKNTIITLIDWFIKADLLSSQGEWLSLRDHAQSWTETMPKNSWAWLNLGVAYYKLNKHSKAIDAYQWAVSIDPTLTNAWNNLGAAYGDTGQLSKAIDAYKRALNIDPEHLEAWNNLGIVYGETDQISKAIDAFQHALNIDPEYAEAWNNLGVAYYLSGNRTAALEVAQTLRQIDPVKAERLFDLILPR